jgi:hypothetical protein
MEKTDLLKKLAVRKQMFKEYLNQIKKVGNNQPKKVDNRSEQS